MNVHDVIYVVTDPGIPAFGRKGASSHVQSVLRELAARAKETGGRVTLVASRIGGEVPDGLEDVEVIELGRPNQKDPAERERALIKLDEEAAQVVSRLLAEYEQTNAGAIGRTLVYQRYSLWSALAMEVAAGQGARTVLEVNAPLVEEQATHRVLVDRPTAEAMTRRVLRAAHFVYAVSTPVAQWAQEAGELPEGSVLAIPNGVDLERFARENNLPDTGGVADAGETLVGDAGGADEAAAGAGGATADKPGGSEPLTIAFVGTFRPWHAPEMLIKAAADLNQCGIPLRLLLVGDGPNLPDTIADAAEAGITVTSTGAVDPLEVPGLLATADLAAAPYPAGKAYFSPLKVAEYLAAGLPTVASGVADLPNLFSRVELALVEPGDQDGFTEALAHLATDADARARMADAGLRAVQERFSWAAVVDRVLEEV